LKKDGRLINLKEEEVGGGVCEEINMKEGEEGLDSGSSL
jgi:hypothetical protein